MKQNPLKKLLLTGWSLALVLVVVICFGFIALGLLIGFGPFDFRPSYIKAQEHFQIGLKYHINGDFDLALDQYTQAIEADRTYFKAYSHRAVIYDLNNQGSKALADNNSVIDIMRDDPWAYASRGTNYYASIGAAYASRGTTYASLGDYSKAIADYSKALDLGADDSWICNPLTGTYQIKDDFDKSQAGKTMLDNPLDSRTHIYWIRAMLYCDNNEYAKAFADYDKIIELNPDKAFAYLTRARAYEDIGEHDKAKADRDKAAQLESSSDSGLPE